MVAHLGQKIKEEAKRKGISVADLASQTGKTTTAIYDIFRKEDLNTDVLRAIAGVFEVPVSWFFLEGAGNVQQVNHGGTKNRNNQVVGTHPEQDHLKGQLAACEDKVKSLEREIQLLQEINDLLKGKK